MQELFLQAIYKREIMYEELKEEIKYLRVEDTLCLNIYFITAFIYNTCYKNSTDSVKSRITKIFWKYEKQHLDLKGHNGDNSDFPVYPE